jgi:hypothetical protein
MRYYILKTEPKRHSRKLLVSYKTFKERTSTVARWLKQILDRSGIDSKHFTALLNQEILKFVLSVLLLNPEISKFVLSVLLLNPEILKFVLSVLLLNPEILKFVLSVLLLNAIKAEVLSVNSSNDKLCKGCKDFDIQLYLHPIYTMYMYMYILVLENY